MKRSALVFAMLVFVPLVLAAQEPVKIEQQLLVNDQKVYTPGFAMGNVYLADPEVADLKVLPGRKEVILYGKAPGRTTLLLADQKGVKRQLLEIVVTTRRAVELERDLKDLLKDYKDVQVRTLAGDLIVSGSVDTKADFEAVNKIVGAAGVRSVVTYKPGVAEQTGRMPGQDAPGGAAGAAAASGTTRKAARPSVEYEVELVEASTAFGSGVYDTGVEPSGRPLVKKRLSVLVNDEGELYFNEPQVTPKDFQGKKGLPPIGIRVRMRPGPIDEAGNFSTYMLIETNVPVGEGSFADPGIQRRARWEFRSTSGTPVGVGGNELLAIADTRRGASGASRMLGLARIAAGAPGVPGGIGAGMGMGTGVAAVATYDRGKKTQLLMILRPRIAAAPQQ